MKKRRILQLLTWIRNTDSCIEPETNIHEKKKHPPKNDKSPINSKSFPTAGIKLAHFRRPGTWTGYLFKALKLHAEK